MRSSKVSKVLFTCETKCYSILYIAGTKEESSEEL